MILALTNLKLYEAFKQLNNFIEEKLKPVSPYYLQHPQFHDLESKAVRCFCAEDLKTMQRWVVGIRLAKVSSPGLMEGIILQHTIVIILGWIIY